MPTNVEIKARVNDMARFKQLCAEVSGEAGTLLNQCDTFFSSDKGRLKLRVVNTKAQLIYYSRSDQAGPKTSEFIVAPVAEVDTMKAALSAALTIRGEVEKERYLFMAGRTRIHCDRVKGLGDYMELEVMLVDGEDVAAGNAEAEALMARLEISEADLCTGAYMDMLEEQARGSKGAGDPV